jgi:long-chain fatty acid transport protein
MRFGSILAVLALAAAPGTAWGGGASVFEQGTPRNGVATAGSAAFADDASTSFFNPAGMARLERSQLMVGSQVVKNKMRFDPEDDSSIFMGGNDGGDAGGWAPGLSSYYVHGLGERWRLGVSLTTPVAGSTDYDNDWLGRYYVTEVSLLTLNLNPAVSYKVTDWLSVGAGANLAYATMDFTLKLPRLPEFSDPTPGDGKLKLDDLDDFAGGWNLGVLFEPRDGTRIGLAYRSEVEFDLDGDFETSNIGTLLTQLGLTEGDAGSEFDVPQIAVLSLYHQLTDELAVLADVMWTDWSEFEYTPIKLSTTGGSGIAIPRDWKDTWRYAIGLEARVAPRLLFQLGFSYDSSPIRSGKTALPDLPVTRIYKFATGFKYELNENVVLGVSYMYADLGSVPIDFRAIGGRLKGDYKRNDLHMVGFSLNWKTGKPI